MITAPIKTVLRDALFGDMVAPTINYFAVGSDGTAVTGAETQLGAELKRVTLLSLTKNGSFDLDAVAELLDTDGALTVRELGFFSNATSTANTGSLVTRILYSRDKTSLESIQFNYALGVRG